MNTFEFTRPLTADALNENLYKTFNVKVNFDKYDRAQLEDYRNLLRTKVHQLESDANFNDLLTNETYQRDKYILGVLNTRIKEMLGEAKLAGAGTAQQQFKGKMQAKKTGKVPSSQVGEEIKSIKRHPRTPDVNRKERDQEKSAIEYQNKKAKFHHEIGWDPRIDDRDQYDEGINMKTNEGKKKAKPDFLDLDKDKDKKEPMKKAAADKKKKEAVKEAKMSSGEKAHHHATEYARSMKEGNLELAMHHRDACDECGGMIQHGPDGKKWHMHSGINKGRPYPIEEGVMAGAAGVGTPGLGGVPGGPVTAAESRKIFRARKELVAESIAQYLAEDEEGKAKAITAGADMVNDFTSWMQRVGNYQTKSMIELSDNIRANFGMQEAEAFKASVAQALDSTLHSLTAAREEINNAVAVLAGEAPAQVPMGQDPAMGGAPADTTNPMAGGGDEDSLNLPSIDDFEASDAAAGGMETAGRMKALIVVTD